MQTKTRLPRNIDQLRETYLFVFDSFAATRSEVAEQLGVSKDQASRLLNRLRDQGLVATQDVNEESQGMNRRGGFAEVVWQAWKSYDDYTREQAEGHFAEAFAIEPAPAKAAAAEAKPASKTASEPAKPVGKRAAAKAEAHIAEALADKPAPVDPKKLVEEVAKATGIRGAKVEPRQNGRRHVIVAQVAGKPALLAYVDPLKRGTGFRVEIANYGGYVTKTVADVAAAAEAVKSSERREPKAKPAAKPAPAKPKAAAAKPAAA